MNKSLSCLRSSKTNIEKKTLECFCKWLLCKHLELCQGKNFVKLLIFFNVLVFSSRLCAMPIFFFSELTQITHIHFLSSALKTCYCLSLNKFWVWPKKKKIVHADPHFFNRQDKCQSWGCTASIWCLNILLEINFFCGYFKKVDRLNIS